MTTLQLAAEARHDIRGLAVVTDRQDVQLMPSDVTDLAARMDAAVDDLHDLAALADDGMAQALHARAGRYAAIRDALMDLPMVG